MTSDTGENKLQRLENNVADLQKRCDALEQTIADAVSAAEADALDPLEEAHQRFMMDIKNRRSGHA